MKKQIITIACTLVAAGTVFAQGVVNWGGISFANVTFQTNTTAYAFNGGATGNGTSGLGQGSAIGGTGYYFELLVGSVWAVPGTTAPTNALSNLSGWADTGLEASNSATAGRLAVVAGSSVATAAGFAGNGTTNYIDLVGWSANLGSTYSVAVSNLNSSAFMNGLQTTAFFGATSIGWINPNSVGASSGAIVFNSSPGADGTPIQSLNTQLYEVSVPEPGTMVLAALGGASMLLFRRRK